MNNYFAMAQTAQFFNDVQLTHCSPQLFGHIQPGIHVHQARIVMLIDHTVTEKNKSRLVLCLVLLKIFDNLHHAKHVFISFYPETLFL